MKYLYFFLILCFTFSLNAQIVDIPDVTLKYFLVNFESTDTDGDQYVDTIVDTNGDGEIQVTEAEAVLNLKIIGIEYLNPETNQTSVINDLTGLSSFSNLEELYIRLNTFNTLTSVDLGENNQSLTRISFETSDAIESINLGDKPNLTRLDISGLDDLTTLDVSNYINLNTLWVNANSLTNLDITNNINLSILYLWSVLNLNSIDLTQNTNLIFINIHPTLFSTVDISQNVNLQIFSGTNLTSIDFTENVNLTTILLESLSQSELDLSQNVNLESFTGYVSEFVELDFSYNPQLNDIELAGNQNLTTLNFKNGSAFNEETYIDFYGNDNLNYVCADIEEVDIILQYVGDTCEVNTYCSFVPGGEYFAIEGNNSLDLNSDGCEAAVNVYSSLKFNITDGTNDGAFVSNTTGSYSMPVLEGMHTISPFTENPTYFTVSPSSLLVNFPTDASPFNQDFCITPNGDYNDLEIVIIPLEIARPGFLTQYKLVYKNKGTTTISDTIELLFNDDLINYVNATPTEDSQAIGILNWNFTNLEPFETREILFQMIVNPPTDATFPVNGGDYLDFITNIFPIVGDETASDNSMQLQQQVFNSFDPNDKTCLEGDTIIPEMVGEYLHYMVRFENTGSANAINVVVKDEIDLSKYDVNSLTPLHASHNYVTRITNTNTVEFIFENINLPFDDANNDGYVLFKIKTKPTLVEGDMFSNNAEIYFDFNFPIITNNFETTVVENLSVNDFESNFSAKLYPNPVENVLNISSQIVLSTVTVYDIDGRILKSFVFNNNELQKVIDLEQLSKGVYFVKLSSGDMESTYKMVKN